jgi:hypothetical protein
VVLKLDKENPLANRRRGAIEEQRRYGGWKERPFQAFGFVTKPKLQTEQEKDQMDDGAATAELRCFDKTCPQQRHGNTGEIEIEIEQNPR